MRLGGEEERGRIGGSVVWTGAVLTNAVGGDGDGDGVGGICRV